MYLASICELNFAELLKCTRKVKQEIGKKFEKISEPLIKISFIDSRWLKADRFF